jgi:hypothetical protein
VDGKIGTHAAIPDVHYVHGTAAAASTTDFAPALGADDNYITNSEKAALHPIVDISGKADLTDARFPTADEKASFPAGASALVPLVLDSDARLTDSRTPDAHNNTAHSETYLTAEVDGSTTNELQDLSLIANILSLSDSIPTVDLSTYLDNTNLSEAQVDAYTDNNGYALGVSSVTAEALTCFDGTSGQQLKECDSTIAISSIDLGTGILELPNGTVPSSADCDTAAEAGRIFIDTDAASGGQVYVCEGLAGWVQSSGGGGGGDEFGTLSNGYMCIYNGTSVDCDAVYYDEATERLGIGTTSPLNSVHIVGEGDVGKLIVDTYSATTANAPGFVGRRGRGTEASPAAVTTNDFLFTITGQGNYDASSRYAGGKINIQAAQPFSSGNGGTFMDFQTISNGTTSSASRFTLNGDGSLSLKGIVNITSLTGTGDAFVCVDAAGILYRETAPCDY